MRGNAYECMAWLSNQDPSKTYECKKVARKRTLTQNAYYWAMLNRLARALRMSDSEVHLNMLREYGVCDLVTLSPEVPVGCYFKYYDDLGTDWIGGEERRTVKAYKGSSSMEPAEFARLIEGMREECESQGVDVATPEEIARMEFVRGKE